MLAVLNEDNNFFNKILWSDESSFSTAGVFNRKNTHYWAPVNPNLIRPIQFSGRRTIKVWCGILNGKILGPLFYDQNLTGARYLEMIQNFINELPQNVYNIDLNDIVWQQDGAPPHNVAAVTDYLNGMFHTWIGRSGQIQWPANSPDLTPLDTFLWGYLKDRINSRNDLTVQSIRDNLTWEIDILNRNDNYFVSNATERLKEMYRECIFQNGGHIEHLFN